MKILHITPTYYPAAYWGGPVFSVYHLNNALAKIPGVYVKVLTTDSAGQKISDRLSVAEKRTRFPYRVIFTRRIAGTCVSPGLLSQLPKWIRWADVVHLTATFSFPTIPTLLLCCIYGKPVVWSLRGALLDDQNRREYDPQGHAKHFLKAAWNQICRHLIPPQRVALHVTTEQEREAVAKVYPHARFSITPTGVEVPDTLPVRNKWLPNGKLRLMFMGRLAPKKGIENLLHAVAKVGVQINLNVYGASTVGQGGQRYGDGLVGLAKDLGILDKNVVRFFGHIDDEAKIGAFLEADVCIIPSYSENFCIVVAEALAMGLPVIVSDRLAWGEVAKRGCGLVVGNDPDSLAEAIEKMRTLELYEMGKRGWEWMNSEYRWGDIADKVCRIYQEIGRQK